MSLRRREQRALQQIGQALSRSDPLLDEEFRAFDQVCLHAAMPSREQIPPSRKNHWTSLWQRLSHSALLALAYAGGAIWLDDLAEDHESQHAGGQ